MRYFSTLFLFIAVYSLLVFDVSAAVLKVERDYTSLKVGDEFTVDLIVDSQGQTLNAVEIELAFPDEFLEYVGSDNGDSVINLWILKPNYQKPNLINLSGITPGGFLDSNNQLVSITFRVIKEGQGKIEVKNASLLVHDGLGTQAEVEKQNLHLSISKGESGVVKVNMVDDEMPESFIPEIIQDADLYEGAYTLIFATEDKGAGLSRYEVKEGIFSKYVLATSPYKLKYQSLDKKIYVKAIDNLGNERVEILYPQNWLPFNQHPWVIVSILILCVLSLLIFWRFFRSRLTK